MEEGLEVRMIWKQVVSGFGYKELRQRREAAPPSLPAARGPAAPGNHWHTPCHSAGLGAVHQAPLLGGKLLPVPRAAG